MMIDHQTGSALHLDVDELPITRKDAA